MVAFIVAVLVLLRAGAGAARLGRCSPRRSRCWRSSPRRRRRSSSPRSALDARRRWLRHRRTRRRRPPRRQGGADRPSPGSRCSASLALAVVRRAALDRLPVLQLADVGHAQAVLRPRVAAEPRDVVPDPARHLHADVVHASSLGLARRVAASLARWRTARRRRAAAARGGSRSARSTADPARRRQRAPVRASSSRRWSRWRPSCSAAIGSLLPADGRQRAARTARCSRAPVVLYAPYVVLRRRSSAWRSSTRSGAERPARRGRWPRSADRRCVYATWPRARRGCSRARRAAPRVGRCCWSRW